MARYYYNKYFASATYYETNLGTSSFTGNVGNNRYSFNTSNGIYTLTGANNGSWGEGTMHFIVDAAGNTLSRENGATGRYLGIIYYDTDCKTIYLHGSEARYNKGSFLETIVAEDRTYPVNGRHTDRYWYVRGSLANTVPTIDGVDSNLGDKNTGFSILYKVNDVDAADNLVVTEKLNNITLKTINGAPRNQLLEIEITNETLFSLPLNSDNTIEIKVDDQKGGIAYRRYTFRRTNTAPIISGSDEDLGQKTEPLSVSFSVTDNEGNALTVKTYLNNVLKEEYIATDGATNTFTISREDWYKLPIGQHSIKIEAIDEHRATAIRNYTFTRYDDKIQFTLKNPIETDIMATKILVTPTWVIPQGAVAKVEACNNGFDEVPTWEDITSQVLISRHYNFTNDIKTAAKWGINIRFTIEKGTATEQVVINGFGGAFE